MPFLAILAVLTYPVLEIVSFVQVSNWIGLLPMLLALGVSAALGIFVIRSQSLFLGQKVMQAMRAGTSPEKPLADAAMLNFAGILLIIPGFFSDLLALLLIIPATRQQLWRVTAGRFKSRLRDRKIQRPPENPKQAATPTRSDDVIDVEFTEVPPDKKPEPGNIDTAKDSPWRKGRR